MNRFGSRCSAPFTAKCRRHLSSLAPMTRWIGFEDEGVLRVGYDPNGLPFSFFNFNNELVGLDIENDSVIRDEIGS